MAIRDLIPIVRLDRKAISRVSRDKRETLRSQMMLLAVVVISSALSIALEMVISPDVWAGRTVGVRVAAIALYVLIFSPIVSLVSLWLMTGLYRGVARLFGGKGTLVGLVRPVAHVSAGMGLLSWIPFVNILAALWSLVANVFVISQVERLSIGRSVGVLLISIAIVAAFAILVALLLLMLLLTLGVSTGTVL